MKNNLSSWDTKLPLHIYSLQEARASHSLEEVRLKNNQTQFHFPYWYDFSICFTSFENYSHQKYNLMHILHILHISDTHNLHRELRDLPNADIIIHSGDISRVGTSNEVVDFIEWFTGLNYSHKIFIAGNHDFSLEGKEREIIQGFLPPNCYYLNNSGVTIEGIKFWGVPFFFSNDVKGDSPEMMALIPLDTNILITHRPPLGVLDKSGSITYGCPDMFEAVSNIRPQYHLFGHIHDAYGVEKSEHTTFANSAVVDENYDLKNEPFVFDFSLSGV